MAWYDDIIKKLPEAEVQIINDSKTPSGKTHVGSLRGVLIHDAMYRILKEKGIPVRYTFGVDDYDPLDELPRGHKEFYAEHMGKPLCNVPAPPGTDAPDIAAYYIKEFFQIFDELGVSAEIYHLRDIYKSGRFNETIDVILRHAAKIREIYLRVSNSRKSENWHPFQVVCEQCGKLGSTEVLDYDGRQVHYVCRPDLVTWAEGCGHEGKVSPFDGNGKLPWKLEWTAKWVNRGITIEGAGTDHNTKGGSRDIASACLRQIFRKDAPVNIPYGFFLMGGAKMSSSKGIGASARDMADLLPPQILRYLMISTQPKKSVNFEPGERHITKIFNGFDKLHHDFHSGANLDDAEKSVYKISEIFHDAPYFTPNFSLLVTLLQLPHIDILKDVETRKGAPLTEIETKILEGRVRSAKHWLEHFATPEELIELQQTLPERARDLGVLQRAFLHNLADHLKTCRWTENDLQSAIFNAARTTPVSQKEAFLAIYTILLNKDAGPKAGNLFSCLERDFLVERFQALDFNKADLWAQTAQSADEFEQWLAAEKTAVVRTSIRVDAACEASRPGVIEFLLTLADDKTHMKRVWCPEPEGGAAPGFPEAAQRYIDSVTAAHSLKPQRVSTGP